MERLSLVIKHLSPLSIHVSAVVVADVNVVVDYSGKDRA